MQPSPANQSRRGLPSASFSVILLLAPTVLCTCTADRPAVQVNDPEMAAYVQLVMPARIEIQRYLTKPVSHDGSGNADGLEAIVAAYDASEDLTKVAGTFHFELENRRLRDRIGSRVAFWPVEVNTDEAMQAYRDPLSRFYHFPLQLDHETLARGRYRLTVWLHLPTGQRLFDQYEFTYDGSPAPGVRPF